MSQVLTISDTLYTQLETIAQKRGLLNIEQLLEVWQLQENDMRQRQEAVQRINTLRERLFVTYGEMPDSVLLIREDRER